MEITNFKPLSETEYDDIKGGWIAAAALIGAIALTAIPLVKSMWNSSSGSIKLPGGSESKWDSKSSESVKTDNSSLVKEIKSLEAKINFLIPPFYEV